MKRWYGVSALMLGVFLFAGTVVLANSNDTVFFACLSDNGMLQNVTIDQAPECRENQPP